MSTQPTSEHRDLGQQGQAALQEDFWMGTGMGPGKGTTERLCRSGNSHRRGEGGGGGREGEQTLARLYQGRAERGSI